MDMLLNIRFFIQAGFAEAGGNSEEHSRMWKKLLSKKTSIRQKR